MVNPNIEDKKILDTTWKKIQGYKVAWDASGHRLITLNISRTKKGTFSGYARIEKSKKKYSSAQ